MNLTYQLIALAHQHMKPEDFEAKVLNVLEKYAGVIQIYDGSSRIGRLDETTNYYPTTRNIIEKTEEYAFYKQKAPERLLFQAVLCVEDVNRGYMDNLIKSMRQFSRKNTPRITQDIRSKIGIDCNDRTV